MTVDNATPGAYPSLFDVGLYLTMHGYNWFLVGFVCMLLSLFATIALDLMRPRGIRLFHQIAIVVLTTASLAYFSMAFDLSTSSPEADIGLGETSQTVSYVWYIQWIINLPLLLLSVLLVTGLSLLEILVTLFAAVVLVLCGLIRDRGSDAYGQWFSVLSLAALGYVIFVLLFRGTKSAYAAGDVFGRHYLFSSAFLSLTLLGYPLAFALARSSGAHALSPEAHAASCLVLDVLAQPAFLFFFLHQVHQIDSGTICGTIALNMDEEDASSFVESTSRRLRRHHRRRY